MFVIVFDDICKKFNEDQLLLIPNITGESKVFTKINKNDKHLQTMVYCHRHLRSCGEIDYDNIVMTSHIVTTLPIEWRSNADYIIFTNIRTFNEYFNSCTHGDTSIVRVSSVLTALKKLNNERIVIWDVHKKNFVN